MTSSRICSAFAAGALCAALVLLPACASKTRPAAAPVPAAPAAAGPPVASVPPPSAPAPAASPAAAPRPPAPAPLLGHLTRDQIRAYASWQPLFAAPYAPDAPAIAAIKARANGLTVLAIVATWCPDSKREVPRFFAIMDEAGISESDVIMVGVDRTKKDPEGLTEKWGITRVPTFVFFRDGQEAGRFVERTPAGATLEGEIARVLAPKQ